MLDDEQLVRPLQQLVDRRAHRALDDRDQLLGVDAAARCRRRACRGRAGCAWRAGRARGSARRPVVEARLGRRSEARPAHQPLRARAGVDPGRLDADDAPRRAAVAAAAMPISETISCVASSGHGRACAASGQRAVIRTSARRAPCRATMCRAMCSASSSTRQRLADARPRSIASSKSSGKRDMWTPFCCGRDRRCSRCRRPSASRRPRAGCGSPSGRP